MSSPFPTIVPKAPIGASFKREKVHSVHHVNLVLVNLDPPHQRLDQFSFGFPACIFQSRSHLARKHSQVIDDAS